MRFSPETDPHYWDHKVYTVGEAREAFKERDQLKAKLEAADLSHHERDKMEKEVGKLKLKRKALKLSLRTVAARMGVSKSALCRFENGERAITAKLFDKYRSALIQKGKE